MQYELRNKYNEPVRMKSGLPFRYSSAKLAGLGAKYLKLKTPKRQRPLTITPV